ncbi:MAG: PfkB family carbohydrate kinase [Candidatus Lokiarchaeota archaeon]
MDLNKEKGSKTIVLGSLAYDYIMGFDENFCNAVSIDYMKEEYQSTVTANSRDQYYGGTAGNIAYNMGLLNTGHISLIGSVGKDFKDYKDHIKTFENIFLGIDIHEDDYTAACFIVNDIKSNQMIIFHGGALDRCKDIDLKDKIENPDEYGYAINSTQSVDAMENFANQLYDLGIPMIFDPGQVTPLFEKDKLIKILKKTNILIGNKHEISQILTKTEYTKEKIMEFTNAIITTLGEKGSELIYKDNSGKIHQFEISIGKPNEVKDTTGAGDGYRAGILSGLMLNLTLIDACRLGSIISSFVVETVGAQTHKFTINDIRKRFLETYGYIPPELESIKKRIL